MIKEILWFVSWPVLIIISYYAVAAVLQKFEKNQ